MIRIPEKVGYLGLVKASIQFRKPCMMPSILKSALPAPKPKIPMFHGLRRLKPPTPGKSISRAATRPPAARHWQEI